MTNSESGVIKLSLADGLSTLDNKNLFSWGKNTTNSPVVDGNSAERKTSFWNCFKNLE